ncbi:uncharacterized protein LOC110435688 isoform X2 [Sorghum bicolor]|uniref:uncharacterized protein LOC110435688 isoform X2 n=1 Tax=Sorghum bicolor TaxID=4558 RepID=UPI000B423F3B|nr:uncharacterized protein LOC110435688 isoform X2 [Sorghum bicolor]|eukprot:XP_021317284.1 uncharacterized protein LOC110435688 isoform X2 [Sorghum bicolor]
MARRGRCHRQRRLRRWSFSSLLKLPGYAYKEWLRFVHKGFFALFQKEYEKDQLKEKEDEVKLKADRFAGYKSICLFGLGSLFWGSATGFLGQLKEKDEKADKAPDRSAWMDFCFLYSAFALLFMLLGVAASSFPNSSWFAPSVAGFGSLQALILVLGGFHVASLKYHSYGKETKYSMIGSTILIIIYWGLSVQDPIILHFVVKLFFWLVSLIAYVVYMGGRMVWQFGKCAWTKIRTNVLSLKSTLMAWNHSTNDYQHLPQTVSSQSVAVSEGSQGAPPNRISVKALIKSSTLWRLSNPTESSVTSAL